MATRRRGGVQEAMASFSDLWKVSEDIPPFDAQQKARAEFPIRVSHSQIPLRHKSTPVPQSGQHVIIGVASYSTEELKLLDAIEARLESDASESLNVEAFDVLDCAQMSDYESFIPGLGTVYRTPVVGVVVDGRLTERASGLQYVVTTLRHFKLLDPA